MTKALLCTRCYDIRRLRAHGLLTECECGTVRGWWVDDERGTAKLFAYDETKHYAWGIGYHNGYLQALRGLTGAVNDWERWQTLHTQICETQSEGYIFAGDKRNCWVAPFKPNWTRDVTWATVDEYLAKHMTSRGISTPAEARE